MNTFRAMAKNNSIIKSMLVVAYILVVLGFSANARANEFATGVATQELFETQGQLVFVGNAYHLMLTPTQSVVVESNLDLDSFVGSWVHIVGYELYRRSGPVYQISGRVDPLSQPVVLNVDSPVIVAIEVTGLPR